MGEAAKPILFEGVKAGCTEMSFCVSGKALPTFSRVCKRVESRFVWQAQ